MAKYYYFCHNFVFFAGFEKIVTLPSYPLCDSNTVPYILGL